MSPRSAAFRIDSGQLCFAMMRNSDCYPTRFESWSLATASDRQNVTLAGEGRHFCSYHKPTPFGEPVRFIRPETAQACMTHETQKRPRLSLLFSTLLNSQKISFSSSEENPPLVWLLLRTSLSTDFLQTLDTGTEIHAITTGTEIHAILLTNKLRVKEKYILG